MDNVPAVSESTDTLYHLFEKAVKQNASKPAVCFKTEFNSAAISYKNLLSECEQVSRIIKDLGIKNGYIGIHLGHSLFLPVVILGILRSGLAFACLNVDCKPWELHIVKYLNIHWIFTDSNLQNENWSSQKQIAIFGNLLSLYKNISVECTDNHKEDDWIMAYAVETSGTTGQPKIVKVPHQCIVPNVQQLKCLLSVVSDDVIFLAAPLTFDPSIIEIFLALSCGALLLIVSPFIRRSPSLLLKMLNAVTIVEATPSFLKCWSREEICKTLLHEKSSLRVLLLGGEPCPTKDILKNWKMKGNNTQIFNIYGITEVSCWATISKVTFNEGIDINEDVKIPLGTALSLTILQVKDQSGNDILDGEGELFVGSTKRVCLVDNETIQDLEFPVFRATGDIVKIDGSNRKIFYIGRKNNIVKRFGHRVSLDKITEVVNCHDSVEQSCCIWNENIEKLGLFLKPEKNCKDKKNLEKGVRQHILKHLHPSHIPDILVTVNSIPLTSHDKVDRCKLENLMIEKTKSNAERYCERDDAIKCFSSLWSQHLCLDSAPSPDDNFVQSGGSSVVAVQLVSDLSEVMGSSGYVGLIGILLGHSSFRECCEYLLLIQDTNIRKSETQNFMSGSASDSLVSTQKRKPTDLIVDYANSNKRINLDYSNSSNKVTNKTYLLLSTCRGRIEIGDGRKLRVCEMEDGIDFIVKWSFDLGKCVDASPRFLLYENGKGIICIGSHSSRFVTIDSRDGKPIVQCNLKDRIESSMCCSLCGEVGVVGCYDGYIYCINLHSGIIIWKFKTERMVKSSPVLCLNGSAITVGSYDQKLYCINIHNGCLIWSTKVGDGSIYASPCVSTKNKSIYMASLDGSCGAFEEYSGALIWKCKLTSPIFSSPGITPEEDVVIFAEVLGLVHFFSAVSGEKLWNFQAGGNIFSSFSIKSLSDLESNMILFGCHDEHVYCLYQRVDSVTLKWKCKLDSAVFATPYVFSAKQGEQSLSYKVVGASTSGIIYIIDSKSGEKASSFQLPGEIFSSPIVDGNEIYIGCRDNNVYCLYIQNGTGMSAVNVTQDKSCNENC